MNFHFVETVKSTMGNPDMNKTWLVCWEKLQLYYTKLWECVDRAKEFKLFIILYVLKDHSFRTEENKCIIAKYNCLYEPIYKIFLKKCWLRINNHESYRHVIFQ